MKRKLKKRKKNHLYAKGRRFEYQVISILKKMGFHIVFRTPCSRGVFDVFALRGNNLTKKLEEAKYIQVKASRSPLSIKTIVPKKEREKIIKSSELVILGKKTFYEIWVRRLNKKWDIYRLNWKSKEFELLSLSQKNFFCS